MADIKKLIAAINPDLYCDPSVREDVKRIIKERGDKGYLEAAKIAKLVPNDDLYNIDDARLSPLDARTLNAPYEEHKLVYDAPNETLEPLYFWILDFVNGMFRGNVFKIVDNFVSSVGSGHFSELGTKMTKMQDEAMKMLGAVNQVVKSILNIVYDLKEFKLRLKLYDQLSKGSPAERSAAMLALKQVWLDNVDIKRGTTSIKAMAQQFDYVTLIDAFMAISSLEQLEKRPEDAGALDLNERVKRLLKQRFEEFTLWLTESERELRKRYNIEKHYLKSQYNTVQLYSRWIYPYLKAAKQLEQSQDMSSNAALVATFNTLLLELTLMCEAEYDVKDDVAKGELPEVFKNIPLRKYYAIVIVDLKFRGIPQRVSQGYAFGGRTEAVFTAYALTKEEKELLKRKIEQDSFSQVMSLIQGATTDSLDEIKKDVELFLNEDEVKKETPKKDDDNTNPFSALFEPITKIFFSSIMPPKEKRPEDPTRPDSRYERIVRSQAIIDARDKCKTLFETYKKAHQMPAF